MANRCLNKVMLIGNLTRDPELRYTPNGVAVCTFGLATNRRWTTQDDQTKEEAQFHRIVAWNRLAELCAQLLAKGRRIYVEGRLQYREWTGSDNVKRQTTEIVIEDMIILDSRQTLGEGRPEKELSQPEVEAAQPEGETSVEETATIEESEEKEKLAGEAAGDDSQGGQAGDDQSTASDDQADQKEKEPEEGEEEKKDIPF